ncbi:hypothetical protein MAR_008730 [Mya arenaria]|uniref:Uncharacterized protein n=1 Tax=Mya arenaria TaxID=6604 RepID=A0ABY7DZZ6_MYAAR|nr:hypothetical protein MAR_008730 [Mya arenaria]
MSLKTSKNNDASESSITRASYDRVTAMRDSGLPFWPIARRDEPTARIASYIPNSGTSVGTYPPAADVSIIVGWAGAPEGGGDWGASPEGGACLWRFFALITFKTSLQAETIHVVLSGTMLEGGRAEGKLPKGGTCHLRLPALIIFNTSVQTSNKPNKIRLTQPHVIRHALSLLPLLEVGWVCQELACLEWVEQERMGQPLFQREPPHSAMYLGENAVFLMTRLRFNTADAILTGTWTGHKRKINKAKGESKHR